MIFTEFRFLFFFLVVFAVYWALSANRKRKVWLLLCSYVFYSAWDWRFLLLILTSTYVDYIVGLQLGEKRGGKPDGVRRRWLVVSLVANLGLLGFFKYYDFFVESGAGFLAFLGLPVAAPVLDILLPVGISFYTFQTLSYSIDVYRGSLRPTRDLLDLALFVGFFPQLVAGPIVRAVDFLPQLRERRLFDRIDVRGCLVLFMVGFAKKAVVSDGIAEYVDQYFANSAAYDAASAWLAMLLYSAQLYCDFSAYSDMAIASAGLLGYNLCLNFFFPYFSRNISELFRRWHVSLSSWIQDYVFLPIGRAAKRRIPIWTNLLITWFLAGLWHGAGWTFVVWGLLAGLGQVVHAVWSRRRNKRVRIPVLGAVLINYLFICFLLVFFRSTDFSQAWQVTRAFLFLDAPGEKLLGDRLIWVFLFLVLLHWLNYKGLFSHWWRRLPGWGFSGVYAVATALLLTVVNPGAAPFIYFQF